MPALYIGHGAPPLLDDPVWSGQLAAWARRPAAPDGDPDRQRALGVGAGQRCQRQPASPLVYDFGGFAPKYYQMTYETPDATALAAAGRGDDARRPSRCTSTPAAASTTAPGCR